MGALGRQGLAYGLKSTAVPLAARILHAALTLELAYGFGGPAAARALAREQRGARFDPEVVDAFLTLEKQADFWQTLEHESAKSVILAMQPPTSADRMMADQIEVVCEALADFVDIKTYESWNHSRIVAEVAVGMGSYLGLGGAEQTRLRCAALVHDIGNVAIPLHILEKGDRRSASEWEYYRLHSYYTQRVLERVEPPDSENSGHQQENSRAPPGAHLQQDRRHLPDLRRGLRRPAWDCLAHNRRYDKYCDTAGNMVVIDNDPDDRTSISGAHGRETSPLRVGISSSFIA